MIYTLKHIGEKIIDLCEDYGPTET